MTVLHKHFSSPLEYANWCTENIKPLVVSRKLKNPWNKGSYGSYGNYMLKGLDSLYNGDTKYNDMISKLLHEVEVSVPVMHRTWQLSQAGAFPNVPAYLRGEPENMFRMTRDISDHSPIRIWIGVISSAGLDDDVLARRGAALCALASVLSEVRQVHLTPYVLNNNRAYGEENAESAIISWDIITSPLNMSEVSASLANSYTSRYLGLEASWVINPRVTGGHVHIGGGSSDTVKKYIPIADQDLFFPSAHLYDELVREPVKEIKRLLALYTKDLDY
jgi:hypothetical protein